MTKGLGERWFCTEADVEKNVISPDELVREGPYSRSGIANMRAKKTRRLRYSANNRIRY
jgi:hypothetical protein